jgi:uncharacterized spore protein YtfJ
MDHFGIAEALSKLDGVRDVLTVKRVFGEPYEVNGVTVIPVAAIRGGGGGGGGEDSQKPDGTAENGNQDSQTQVGAGAGFGVVARPVGVFVVHGERVRWEPAIDITRIVAGGQVVAVAALLVLRRLVRGRR